ncbi:MAG: diacylglycerol kinase family protein [Acidobacteriota bacterium]
MAEIRNPLHQAACIINPGAAPKKWLRRKWLNRYLDKLPVQRYEVLSDKKYMRELVRELSHSHQTIIAIGGDGTIADVLQGIREAGKEKEVVLGIIPMGSGNAFRKSLAIPNDIRKAVRILSEGKPRIVNLMDLEGQVAGFSSIGATAAASDAGLRHAIKGFWGHAVAGLSLLSLPRWEVEVELEDGLDRKKRPFQKNRLRLRILDCVVAKSNYFGYSWRIAPQASLDDDYLDITFFEMSGWMYALCLPLLYLGLYQRTLKHYKAKKLILRGKNLPVQYHGEFLGTMDKVEVRVLPQAIKIICPAHGR